MIDTLLKFAKSLHALPYRLRSLILILFIHYWVVLSCSNFTGLPETLHICSLHLKCWQPLIGSPKMTDITDIILLWMFLCINKLLIHNQLHIFTRPTLTHNILKYILSMPIPFNPTSHITFIIINALWHRFDNARPGVRIYNSQKFICLLTTMTKKNMVRRDVTKLTNKKIIYKNETEDH